VLWREYQRTTLSTPRCCAHRLVCGALTGSCSSSAALPASPSPLRPPSVSDAAAATTTALFQASSAPSYSAGAGAGAVSLPALAPSSAGTGASVATPPVQLMASLTAPTAIPSANNSGISPVRQSPQAASAAAGGSGRSARNSPRGQLRGVHPTPMHPAQPVATSPSQAKQRSAGAGGATGGGGRPAGRNGSAASQSAGAGGGGAGASGGAAGFRELRGHSRTARQAATLASASAAGPMTLAGTAGAAPSTESVPRGSPHASFVFTSSTHNFSARNGMIFSLRALAALPRIPACGVGVPLCPSPRARPLRRPSCCLLGVVSLCLIRFFEWSFLAFIGAWEPCGTLPWCVALPASDKGNASAFLLYLPLPLPLLLLAPRQRGSHRENAPCENGLICSWA